MSKKIIGDQVAKKNESRRAKGKRTIGGEERDVRTWRQRQSLNNVMG